MYALQDKDEPKTYREAFSSAPYEKWKVAIGSKSQMQGKKIIGIW